MPHDYKSQNDGVTRPRKSLVMSLAVSIHECDE